LTYFSLGSGILALGIEVLVVLSLMEMPPFGKGGSDIVWALPFFALIIFALAMPGLMTALSAIRRPARTGKFAMTGLALNGVSLAFPILLLVVAAGSPARFDRWPNESVNASLNTAGLCQPFTPAFAS
jgi:hypothetical protein